MVYRWIYESVGENISGKVQAGSVIQMIAPSISIYIDLLLR